MYKVSLPYTLMGGMWYHCHTYYKITSGHRSNDRPKSVPVGSAVRAVTNWGYVMMNFEPLPRGRADLGERLSWIVAATAPRSLRGDAFLMQHTYIS